MYSQNDSSTALVLECRRIHYFKCDVIIANLCECVIIKNGSTHGLREGGSGVHRTRALALEGARAQGARKSLGFRVKFWYCTQERI